jgi:hypothetical protein
MGQGRALWWIAFTIVYVSALVETVTAAEKKQFNVIKILEATYGGNCELLVPGSSLVVSRRSRPCAHSSRPR